MFQLTTLLCLCLAVTAVTAVTAAVHDSGDVPLTAVSDPEAVCLDGSRYAYYFRPASTGADTDKWAFSIEGGGWCYNETECLERAATTLGSSTQWPKQSHLGGLLDVNATYNPEFSTWNAVYLRYCDGGSFSGYRSEPWPVPGSANKTVYFRGFRNLQATLMDLVKLHDLDAATDIIVNGGSAGGLSTFLHVDYVAAMFPKARTVGLPGCGFFLDHLPDPALDVPSWYTYPNWMKYVYEMQNASYSLSPECQAAMGGADAWKCIMAPHAFPYIKSPLFLHNSMYDHWQLANILEEPCIKAQPYGPPYPSATCNTSAMLAVQEYGPSFLSQVNGLRESAHHGGFLAACIIHEVPWGTTADLHIDGVTPSEAFAAWYFQRTAQTWWVESCASPGPCNPSPICAPYKPSE